MKNITLLSEKDFPTQMNDMVIPFINSHKTIHSIESVQKGNIHVETLLPDGDFHSVLVIFHGFCEFCAKYDEFTYYALQQGYAVCRFDHRGHGFSARDDEVKTNPSKVHIKNFNTYVLDAHKVIETIVTPLANGKNLFLFAHSMGGAIGALYLMYHPGVFTRAILNSPMFQVNTKGLPLWLASISAKLLCSIKGKTVFAPSQRAFPYDDLIFNHIKHASTSVERHSYFYKIRYTDERLQTWGGTMLWLSQCFWAMGMCKKGNLLKKITTPILLLQAEYDATVFPKGQNRFVKRLSNAELFVVKKGNHEVFIGKNQFALPWYEKIFEYYEKVL